MYVTCPDASAMPVLSAPMSNVTCNARMCVVEFSVNANSDALFSLKVLNRKSMLPSSDDEEEDDADTSISRVVIAHEIMMTQEEEEEELAIVTKEVG
mgnify:CR=1 FL=1